MILNMFMLVVFNISYCSIYRPYPILSISCTSITVVILLKLISYSQVNDELFSIRSRLFKQTETKLKRQASVEVFTHYEISQ